MEQSVSKAQIAEYSDAAPSSTNHQASKYLTITDLG